MNSTGVAVLAFARLICSFSRSVIVVDWSAGASSTPDCEDICVIGASSSLSRRRRDAGGLTEPVVEPGQSEHRAVVRHERVLLHMDAVVAGVRVGHDLAWILRR